LEANNAAGARAREQATKQELISDPLNMHYAELLALRRTQGLDEIYFPPSVFKRAVEFDDWQMELVSDVTQTFARPLTSFWSCRMEDDTNLRHLADNVPPGIYDIIWFFAWKVRSNGQTTGVGKFNLSVGKAVNESMFMARTYDPAQPFISKNLNHVMYDRVTVTMQVPDAETLQALADAVDEDGYINRGKVGHASLRVRVERGSRVAFLIKRVGGPVNGTLMFGGVALVPFFSAAEEPVLPDGAPS